ncbi:MAG: ABC transporter permease subunit [Anaerolineae bacterium]
MIANLIAVVRGEFFKLRRRPMAWVLLGICVLFGQALVWSGYVAYASLQARAPDSAALAQQYASFVLPESLVWVFRVASSIGLIAVAILTASVMGSEYGLATLRPMLIRGIGRASYLVGKLATLMLAAGAALLVTGVLAAASSVVAAVLATAPPGGAPPSASWSDALGGWLITWLSLLPYIALTAMVTVLARSASVGMAVSLGYYLLESVLSATLTSTGSAGFGRIAGYLLLHNITAVTRGGFIGVAGGTATEGPAALRLALYTVVMATITLVVFLRRDIHGPSGN